MDGDRLTLVVVADVAPDAVETFRRYEARVLPLLTRYGGRLERRLRTADGLTEVHVVSFAERTGHDGYVADPERAVASALLAGAAVSSRVLEAADMPVDPAALARAARDAELDEVLIGGREPVTVTIADPDPTWPERFRALRERITAALGPLALDVHHVGSTSVPGLSAKPIVDVLLLVPDIEDEPAYVPAMERAGFVLRVREPRHRMFRTPESDAHVHVEQPDDPDTRDLLDLRDWLRVSAEDRALYAAAKRALAARSWDDMNDYADAKSDVVRDMLGRARAWRAAPRG